MTTLYSLSFFQVNESLPTGENGVASQSGSAMTNKASYYCREGLYDIALQPTLTTNH